MARIETVRENWADITNKLLRDKQLLAHFLRFSAGMYKQSFSDAALIYQQNPYATKVATLETWNKLGRLVNRGEHSIAVFGEDNRAKHLFDISQTNGKRIPNLWKLTEDLAADLTAVINKKYGRNCKNIQEVIAAMSVDNTRPYLTEMMYATQQMKLTDSDLKTYQQSFVSAGIMTGMGYLAYAFLFVVILGLVDVFYAQIEFGMRKRAVLERTLHITMPEDLDYVEVFDDLFARYTEKYSLVSVKTTNMGSLFKLTYQITFREAKAEKAFIDEIRCRNGNLEVALSYQESGALEMM